MNEPSPAGRPQGGATPRNLELRALLLLALLLLLVGAAAAYLLYARGVFEPTQRLVLVAENSEGVTVGMDLTFAGFPVGRVRSIELAPDGNARILVDVPRRDAHWLRETSVFTLVRGLVGNTSLRAYTGIPTDPPLPDGAERRVLIGDATAEIPRLVSDARDLLANLTALSAADAPLARSLANVQEATERLKGPRGALAAVFGNEADAKKLVAALDRVNALLARADGLAARVDGLAAKADAQVFGADGVLKETRDTIVQLNGALADARNTLKRADALLAEAQAIAVNARGATNDLDALRAEVDASLRKVQSLVDEIARKWPFARDTELRLP
jgi:phospholipid/cholesterol/gamma-HCH transport system substrate-binding protein